MEDLIKALQIFAKYDNPKYPTHCEHDELFVMIDPELVSDADKAVLAYYGFLATGDGTFRSSRFGSA